MSTPGNDLSALFGEGGDMSGLLAQAQAMQAQMQAAQEKLAGMELTGTAGGGLVEVTLTGEGLIQKVKISPQACDPEDVESLEDLVTAAFRDAMDKVGAAAQATMGPLGGFGM